MSMEEAEEEDDVVVIEGGELHRALVNVGYTDFEFAPVRRESTASPLVTYPRRNERSPALGRICKGLSRFADFSPRASSRRLTTLLAAECLLDDHRALVETLLRNNRRDSSGKFTDRSILFVCCAAVGIRCFGPRRNSIRDAFLPLSVGVYAAYREYKDAAAVRSMNNFVSALNRLFRAYKKILRILRSVYGLGAYGEKARRGFGVLDVDRLKFLPPLLESLVRSMEKMCRFYDRAASSVAEILPEDARGWDARTDFHSESSTTIQGEITYDALRRLYYVYVLAQSDALLLLAIASSADTWTGLDERLPLSVLGRIVNNLCGSLTKERNDLESVVRAYESSTRKTIERKLRLGSASKRRDLCLNLDMLSRKLRTVYDEIASILGELEERPEDERPETYAELASRIKGISLRLNESINLAELNELLTEIVVRGRAPAADPLPAAEGFPMTRSDRAIERDSEPRIIDEVFVEYATHEYSKGLHEECEEASAEAAKLDALLAKNFMSELKDALVEKSKSMSERETRALLRKYPGECPDFEGTHLAADPDVPRSQHSSEERRRELLRTLPLSSSPETDFSEKGLFTIGLPDLGFRRLPTFVACEEEYLGSGEHSEEEPETKDSAN